MPLGTGGREICLNMGKVYITKANAKRIVKRVYLSEFPDIAGEVYKKPIYFLSRWEIKYLLIMRSLLKEPEKIAIEVYKPIENKDTLKYIYETEMPSSYHYNKDCERLTSTFKNFEIPHEIKERTSEKWKKKGKSEEEISYYVRKAVENFRIWFKDHRELFYTDSEKFLKELDTNHNIQRRIEEIEKNNSGIEEMENWSLTKLEAEIDKIIYAAGKYFKENESKQDIIKRFQKLTFLAYRNEKIKVNDTELSDEDLKSFLMEYDTKFKKPIMELLFYYYRVLYNPDMSFEGELLERLNFRPCSACTLTEYDKINNAILSDYNNVKKCENKEDVCSDSDLPCGMIPIDDDLPFASIDNDNDFNSSSLPPFLIDEPYTLGDPFDDRNENPWINVFGYGEEAETAYWNTD